MTWERESSLGAPPARGMSETGRGGQRVDSDHAATRCYPVRCYPAASYPAEIRNSGIHARFSDA